LEDNCMKIKHKLIETVRIRQDRAELLKAKALALTIASGIQIQESDIANFLFDEGISRVIIEGDTLKLK
jgi:predicted metal-dependent RNase